MDPEYDREKALLFLQAAITEHAARTNEKMKYIYTIKVSIKYISEKMKKYHDYLLISLNHCYR